MSEVKSLDAASNRAREARTLASRAYDALRHQIIGGHYPPGRRLRIQALCQEFGVGLSPMREALTRLSRDRLIEHEDQRGFSMPPLDEPHLEELTKTRCWLNSIGLRESIEHGDDRWEEGLLIAYHRLSKLPTFVSEEGAGTINPAWEQAHRAFHKALISACGSRWLLDYCDQLFDAADYYRHFSRRSPRMPDVRASEHERILKAALARDADGAVSLLEAHLRRTTEQVRERMETSAGPEPAGQA